MQRLMIDLNAAISNLPMVETAVVVGISVIIAWALSIATFMLLLRD